MLSGDEGHENGGTTPRVLFVTRKWPPAVGGMETYSVELARELEQLCHLTVLKLPGRDDGRSPGPLALAAFVARALGHLLVRGRGYDAIILGDLVLFVLAPWSRICGVRARIVQTVHGTDVVYGRREGVAPAIYRGYLRFAALAAGAVDDVVANSSATAEQARRVGLRAVRVVPLGVRSSAAPTTPDQQPETYLLFVGRVTVRKGVDWFVERVMPQLPEDLFLKVVGTVTDPGIARILSANPRVELLGPVHGEMLADLRAGALAVVVPNRPMRVDDFVEGFGLVAAEAAAAGALVLASAVDGLCDAVEDGVTGYLLPPGDDLTWSDRIQAVAAWPAERRAAFVAAARARAIERFDWARVAKETLDAARVDGCRAGHEVRALAG